MPNISKVVVDVADVVEDVADVVEDVVEDVVDIVEDGAQFLMRPEVLACIALLNHINLYHNVSYETG